jgi:hypothetical protein
MMGRRDRIEFPVRQAIRRDRVAWVDEQVVATPIPRRTGVARRPAYKNPIEIHGTAATTISPVSMASR